MRRLNDMKLVAAASVLLLGGSALAQDAPALPETPAAGAANKGDEPEIALDVDREIDLANVVTSAAKGVTTVQEAPAIITIITADEIKQRGFRTLTQALAIVPGWMETRAVGGQTTQMLVRGVGQAQLILKDGVSNFDPLFNSTTLQEGQGLEMYKRIEVVTGPGGVLWGANSYLGIVNLIPKEADDVDGLEVNAGYGDGPGNREYFKAYAMFGKSFFRGKFKMMQHVSAETWIGQTFDKPQFVASSPAPQPIGPAFYGKNANYTPERSWVVRVDGKYSLGPINLYFDIPFGAMHFQNIFANATVPQNTWTTLDRTAAIDYKGRFWKDRFGLTVKGYWTQFVRQYDVMLFPPSVLFPPNRNMAGDVINPGGLRFSFPHHQVHRIGLNLDTDLNLPKGFRVLLGGEFFYEFVNSSTVTYPHSTNVYTLPLVCPQRDGGNTMLPDEQRFTAVPECPRQFVFDSSRFVGAAYVNLQWKPIAKLTFDGGFRAQGGFGNQGYGFVPLGSAAVVWNFLPDFHLKANYATGFRAPTYLALQGAPGGITYGGDPNLKPESSQAFQGELNGRLLRNVRKVRELEVRVDYSYSFLDKFIIIQGGQYVNRGQRAMHSVEAAAKLYLQGDHVLSAAYTYLYAQTTDLGVLRNNPNHWVVLGASFNVVKHNKVTFDLNTTLLVTGAYQDPNRWVSGPAPIGSCPTGSGSSFGLPACQEPATQARTSDLTHERLTPVALLQLGFRLRFFKEKLGISGQFYNVLNQRFWWPDTFNDLTPSIEMTPTPAQGFNFFTSISYHP
jgi:outer membrane receptor protein involved in Fe transport